LNSGMCDIWVKLGVGRDIGAAEGWFLGFKLGFWGERLDTWFLGLSGKISVRLFGIRT